MDSMDELEMVRELFPAPEPPRPEVRDTIRATLAEPSRHDGRRAGSRGLSSRALVRVGLPVTAGVAAAAVVVALLPQAAPLTHGSRPPSDSRPSSGGLPPDVFQVPAGAVPAAGGAGSGRQTLLTAAMRVARTAAQNPGRYWEQPGVVGNFQRVGPASDHYLILEKVGVQQWTAQSAKLPSPSIEQPLGVQFASSADARAWQADGSPSSWPDVGQDTSLASPQGYTDGFSRPVTIAAGKPVAEMVGYGSAGIYAFGRQMSAAQVLALPTAPAAVKALLMRQYRGSGTSSGGLVSYLLSAVPQLMTLPVTPAFRAALYQVLAGLPGVRSLGSMQDVAGQRGEAVAVDGHWTGCGEQMMAIGGSMNMEPTFSSCDVQQILIIDPVTGLPMASELRYTRLPAGQSWSAPDGLFSYEIFGASQWTNANPPVK